MFPDASSNKEFWASFEFLKININQLQIGRSDFFFSPASRDHVALSNLDLTSPLAASNFAQKI